MNVTCGVPQGSVVGLCYSLYINDIVKASNFNTVLYDINLHISGKNHKILEKTVKHELKEIDYCVRANKLCINYSKSNFMLMNKNNRNNINFSVSINHHLISKQNSLKYLGVILDDKLNWKPQIEKLVTQLSKSCGMLFKLKHYSNISGLKSVYFSLFHSYLSYSVLNWGRANKTLLFIPFN